MKMTSIAVISGLFPVRHDKFQMVSSMGKIFQTNFLRLPGKTKHGVLSFCVLKQKESHFSFQTNKYKITQSLKVTGTKNQCTGVAFLHTLPLVKTKIQLKLFLAKMEYLLE